MGVCILFVSIKKVSAQEYPLTRGKSRGFQSTSYIVSWKMIGIVDNVWWLVRYSSLDL